MPDEASPKDDQDLLDPRWVSDRGQSSSCGYPGPSFRHGCFLARDVSLFPCPTWWSRAGSV